MSKIEASPTFTKYQGNERRSEQSYRESVAISSLDVTKSSAPCGLPRIQFRKTSKKNPRYVTLAANKSQDAEKITMRLESCRNNAHT